MTKELEGRLSSLLGLGLLLGPLERSVGIARELLAGRHAALFGTRWSGLQMVMVSNRCGSYSTANERQQAIERYNKRGSASEATIDQAVAVEQSPNAKITNDYYDDWKFTEEFLALPRPYVVVAGTTD